jgi:CelD/BcsL family acetyltransferase involved in cellulose biosynthesis
MAEVVEINDVDELAQYRMLWNSLFAGTPNASFFLTFDWFETYWRHFGCDQKMRVLVVYSLGEPLGIVPLCVRRERYRVGNVRVLTYPLDNWSTWFGPIGPNPASTMLAAMHHIRHSPRDWDMIELRWVPDEGVQGGKTARAMRVTNQFSAKQEYEATSLVELGCTWEQFLSHKSHTLRRHFQRTVREFADGNRYEYIRHRPFPATQGDGDPRWDIYAMCEAIALDSWQSQVTRGNTLTHDRVREYFRDAHSAASRLGMADVSMLTVDGRPAAFLYGYHWQNNVTGLRTGFDSSIGDGLGTALMVRAIHDSCHRGDHVIDLGPGEREDKRRLRTRTETTYRISYTPIDSWRSQAVRFSRWAKNRLKTQPATSAIS